MSCLFGICFCLYFLQSICCLIPDWKASTIKIAGVYLCFIVKGVAWIVMFVIIIPLSTLVTVAYKIFRNKLWTSIIFPPLGCNSCDVFQSQQINLNVLIWTEFCFQSSTCVRTPSSPFWNILPQTSLPSWCSCTMSYARFSDLNILDSIILHSKRGSTWF